MTATIDASQVSAFAAELRAARPVFGSEAEGVVAKGAQNVKKDAKATLLAALGSPTTLPRLAGAISYDITTGAGVIGAEIGPDQAISGLGVGVEFGSAHHSPIPFLHPALDREMNNFIRSAAAVVVKTLGI